MALWKLITENVKSKQELPFLCYCDSENSVNNRTVKFHSAFSSADVIVKKIGKLNLSGPLSLLFSESITEILGTFPCIIAALRLSRPFYIIKDDQNYKQEMENIGSNILLSGSKISNQCLSVPLDQIGTIFVLHHENSLALHSSNQDLAYVISTSGSTGNPKLVWVSESSIIPNIIDFCKEYNLSSKDRLFLASPLTFDPSILDICLSLVTGARLLIIPQRQKTGYKLHSTLFDVNKTTVLQCTPSLLNRIFPSASNCRRSSLRILSVGGEIGPPATKEVLAKLIDLSVQVYHMYGLTEMSVWQSLIKLSADTIARMPIYIKGKNLLSETEVTCDTKGEIVVTSKTRCCYTGRRQRSTKLNVPHIVCTGDIGAWEGDSLYWVGRKDRTVKIHGRKVNLDYIQSKLSAHLNLQVECIFSQLDSIAVAVIVCDPNEYEQNYFIRRAGEILSGCQLPGRFVMTKSIPYTSHGKVDRRQLQTIKTNVALMDCGDKEDLARKLWADILKRVPSSKDNFVECGGDSFLAVTFINGFKSAFPNCSDNMLQTLMDNSFEALLEVINQDLEKDNRCHLSKRLKLEQIVTKNRQMVISDTIRHRLKGRQNFDRILREGIVSKEIEWISEWKVDFEKCIDSSPLFIDRWGGILVVGSHSGWVKCVNISDGEERWSVKLSDRVEASPTCDPGASLILIGCYDHSLYCLSAVEGKVLWRFVTGGIVKCTPILRSDAIYFGSYDHSVYCITLDQGRAVWERPLSCGSIYASPVSTPLGVVVATLSGWVAMMEPDTGQECWKIKLDKPVFATPLYYANEECLIVATVGNVVSRLSMTGVPVWTCATSGPIFSSPIFYRDSLLLGCHDCYMYRISLDGRVRWKAHLGNPIFACPDYSDVGHIIAATTEGNLFVLDENGSKIGQFKINGQVFSSPIFLDKKIFIGSRDNFLYGLKVNYMYQTGVH